MNCLDDTLLQGRYFTIEGTAKDENDDPVDVSSGYTFAVAVKPDKALADTDPLTLVYKLSATSPTRFAVQPDTFTVRVYVLLSAETKAAPIGRYYWDAWAVKTADGGQTPIAKGEIIIEDSTTNTKA